MDMDTFLLKGLISKKFLLHVRCRDFFFFSKHVILEKSIDKLIVMSLENFRMWINRMATFISMPRDVQPEDLHLNNILSFKKRKKNSVYWMFWLLQ